MALTLTTPPTAEPVSVAEAKSHLRLDSSVGEPAPIAPTVALAGLGAGNVTTGAHRYLVTFVTADGETEAGTVSSAVTTSGGDGQVAISAIPLGGALVTSRKVYRTTAGGSTYLLLATIANNTATTYADNIADGSLGAQAPTSNTTVDPAITLCIQAARMRAEHATQRQLITATYTWKLRGFPCEDELIVPRPPLLTVTSIAYVDAAGDSQTWASSNYVVDAPAAPRCPRGRIALAYGISWPTTREQLNAVTITYTAGYGATAASVPALLRQAILIDIGRLYEQREEVITGTIVAELPGGCKDIYKSFRSYGWQTVAA